MDPKLTGGVRWYWSCFKEVFASNQRCLISLRRIRYLVREWLTKGKPDFRPASVLCQLQLRVSGSWGFRERQG